jgi:hypothetical protein
MGRGSCLRSNEANATGIPFFYQPSLTWIRHIALSGRITVLVFFDAPVIHRMIHGFYGYKITKVRN